MRKRPVLSGMVIGRIVVVALVASLLTLPLAFGCTSGNGGSAVKAETPVTPTPSAVATDVVTSAPVKHVTVGDLSVGYRVIGPLASASSTQTPLLMIIGSSSTMDMWPAEFVSALAQDRQVIVFDNRGMGETNNPKGAYPFAQLADDTAGLVKALGYEKLDVLGWSMGGDAAVDLAARHPEAISRLISYAGNPGGELGVSPSAKVLAVLTDTSGDPQQRGIQLLELMYPEAYRTAHPDYMRSFPMPTEQMEPAAMGLQGAAIGGWAGVGEAGLKGISAPSLFVTGNEDLLAPPENAVRMAQRVPNSWLMRFPGTGHALMYQEPAPLTESILLFLRVNGGGPS